MRFDSSLRFTLISIARGACETEIFRSRRRKELFVNYLYVRLSV